MRLLWLPAIRAEQLESNLINRACVNLSKRGSWEGTERGNSKRYKYKSQVTETTLLGADYLDGRKSLTTCPLNWHATGSSLPLRMKRNDSENSPRISDSNSIVSVTLLYRTREFANDYQRRARDNGRGEGGRVGHAWFC